MSKTMIKTGLVTLGAVLLATTAMAQDGERRWRDRGDRPVTANPDRPQRPDRPVTRPTPPPVVVTPRPTPPPVVVTPPRPPVYDTPRWGFGFGNQTPGIDRRQHMQAWEIERGIRNGSITRREADALRAEQARIAEMERRAKIDGVVTPEERQRIRQAQREAGQHIAEEAHDRERRGWGGGWGRGWW